LLSDEHSDICLLHEGTAVVPVDLLPECLSFLLPKDQAIVVLADLSLRKLAITTGFQSPGVSPLLALDVMRSVSPSVFKLGCCGDIPRVGNLAECRGKSELGTLNELRLALQFLMTSSLWKYLDSDETYPTK